MQALRGLSIEVPNGQIVALLGSNGAGKTTTLKAASGVLPLRERPARGGPHHASSARTSAAAPRYRLARAGMAHVREGRHIFGDLTVEENLVAAGNALTGRRRGDVDPELVFGYFPRLRERRKQLAGYLSGGEQQMLAIGRAIVGQPRLILPRRALARPGAAGRAGHLRDHRPHQPRAGRGDAAGRAERARRARRRPLRLHPRERPHRRQRHRPTKLLGDPDVQRFYLGSGGEGEAHVSFRDVKHYKRRKRWLS